jgi:hypothetical protein
LQRLKIGDQASLATCTVWFIYIVVVLWKTDCIVTDMMEVLHFVAIWCSRLEAPYFSRVMLPPDVCFLAILYRRHSNIYDIYIYNTHQILICTEDPRHVYSSSVIRQTDTDISIVISWSLDLNSGLDRCRRESCKTTASSPPSHTGLLVKS